MKEIISFLSKNFPNVQGALLTGSYLSNHKENSDIDLIIFSDVISQPFVEKVKINSQKYDLIYLSTNYNYLIRNFFLDINARYGIYLNMISTSRILIDKNNFLSELLLFIEKVVIQEYGDINYTEIEFKRKLISNALEDLEDIDSFGEYYYATYLIVDEITNLLLAYRVSTIGRGKNKARELNKIAPKFYFNLMNAIENRDNHKFKKLIVKELDYFGGVMDSYSPKNIPSLTTSTELVCEIHIKKKYIKDDFIKNGLFELVKRIELNNGVLNFYYFYNDFFIININLLDIKKHTISSLKKWIIYYFNVSYKDKVMLKSKQIKILPFCNEEINIIIKADLCVFTNLLVTRKLVFKNDIEKIFFLKHFVKRTLKFLNMDIFDYIYTSNLAESYNIDNNYYNYFQLHKERKKKIKEINILNEIFTIEYKDTISDIFFDKSLFLKKLKNTKIDDLSYDSKVSKHILVNLFFKHVFDLLNSNHLSLIGFNLNNSKDAE